MVEGEHRRVYHLHVFVEGEHVRRDARVVLGNGRLDLDDRRLSLDSLFWVSRRAGLLLLFARDFTAAFKGEGSDLDELARAVERGSDQNVRRHRLLQPLAREVVVCTAGTAVTGRIADLRVEGLHVAVFTQRALHLLSRNRRHTLEWPLERARRTPMEGEREGEVLHLAKEDSEIRLRYLFPEEIRAALRAADRAGEAAAGGMATARPRGEPLEMFARGEVAPPFPARLPKFTVSVDSLQEAAVRAARKVPADLLARVSLPPHFFELHFQELGEIALGPLLLRKSAASTTLGLGRALDVMDAEELGQDTRAAVSTATDRLLDVYESELGSRLREKGLSARYLPGVALAEDERARLRERMQTAVEGLAPHLGSLAERQEALEERLRELESGPPEGEEEEEEVEEGAAEWRTALRRLDRAYEAAWRELLGLIEETWARTLLPRLARVEALGSKRLPDRARWAIAAGAVILLVGLALLLL